MKLVQKIKAALRITAKALGITAKNPAPSPTGRNLPAAQQDAFFMAQPRVLIVDGDFKERLATEEEINFPKKARG